MLCHIMRIIIFTESSKLVACATESALEVTNKAISALENSSTQDANKLAAELAAKAFEELARKSQVNPYKVIFVYFCLFRNIIRR